MSVSATNLTGLYTVSGNASPLVPTQPYGNANVVGLLAAGTDGANTISNIIATGTVEASQVNAETFFGQGVAVQGYDFVQMQYSNATTLPLSPYSIGTGSWFYLDSGGATFQSNTTGTLKQIVLGNDSSISATGNIAGNYFIGNGSQLTGLPATYGNSNVATFLANFGSNSISTTGNITANNLQAITGISASGNITTAGYFVGNFSGNITGNLTVPGSNTQVIFNNNGNAGASAGFTFDSASNTATVDGNVVSTRLQGTGSLTVEANGFSSSSLSLYDGGSADLSAATTVSLNAGVYPSGQHWYFYDTGNLEAPGAISAVGNITGDFFIGNGSQLTGLPATYSNAEVAAFLADFGSNVISSTGNITGDYFIGNGSQLTGLPATYSNADVATFLADFGANSISTTGNVTAGYFIGDGAFLTNIPAGNITNAYGNSNVATFLADFGANAISTTGNITGGNLRTSGSAGNIVGVDYISANYFVGNGSLLTSITAANADSANTAIYVTGNAQGNITSVGILTSVSVSGNVEAGNVLLGDLLGAGNVTATGNVTGGNINTGGLITATGNITVGNVLTGGIVSATGNIVTAGNVLTDGVVSAIGNVTGNYILGNGSQLTGIAGTYGNANVSNFLANFGSNVISTTGNVTSGNVNTGVVSATGNIYALNTYIAGSGTVAVFGTTSTATTAVIANSFPTTVAIGGNASSVFLGNPTSSTTTIRGNANVVGNTQSGNLRTTGLITATGTVTGSSLLGSVVSVSANITGGNILTGGLISATGNITGGNILTAGLVSMTGSSQAASYSASGNITGGNIVTGGLVTATGNITGGNLLITSNIQGISTSSSVGILNYKDIVYTLTYASTITPDVSNGQIQQVTLTGNVTWNAFGGTPQAGQSMLVKLIQDGTGGRTLTSTMKWAGGTKTLSTAAGAVDIAAVFYDGTNYYASLTLAYA